MNSPNLPLMIPALAVGYLMIVYGLLTLAKLQGSRSKIEG